MRNLEIDSQTTLSHVLNELKTTSEDGLELTTVPGLKNLLDNPLNKKIIEKFAKDNKKEVVFPALAIEQAPEVESDDMGFVDGEDVIAKAPIEDVHKIMEPAASVAAVSKTKSPSKSSFSKFFKNKFVWLGFAIILLISLLWVGFFVLPSAEVVITAKTEGKESQLTLTGDPNAKTASAGDNVISIETAEVTKEGKDEQATTGKKTIGTVAKGRVTVTNQDDTSAKTFVAGTILTSTADATLTFKLDSDVAVEQAPTGGEKTAGVNVTAIKAGTESNLTEGVIFKVGSSPTALVFAKNDNAFSGGSSKLATVASQEDRDSLKNKIIEKLEAEAKSEIEEKQKDVVVIEDSFEVKVTKEEYDPKNVDAETEKLKATIGLTATASFVDKGVLKKLVIETLSKDTTSGSLSEDNLDITLKQQEKGTDGKLTLIADIKAELVPEINQAELRRSLAGKNLSQAQNHLDNLDEVSEYKVIVSPFHFRLLGRIPFSDSKINIQIDN